MCTGRMSPKNYDCMLILRFPFLAWTGWNSAIDFSGWQSIFQYMIFHQYRRSWRIILRQGPLNAFSAITQSICMLQVRDTDCNHWYPLSPRKFSFHNCLGHRLSDTPGRQAYSVLQPIPPGIPRNWGPQEPISPDRTVQWEHNYHVIFLTICQCPDHVR